MRIPYKKQYLHWKKYCLKRRSFLNNGERCVSFNKWCQDKCLEVRLKNVPPW